MFCAVQYIKSTSWVQYFQPLKLRNIVLAAVPTDHLRGFPSKARAFLSCGFGDGRCINHSHHWSSIQNLYIDILIFLTMRLVVLTSYLHVCCYLIFSVPSRHTLAMSHQSHRYSVVDLGGCRHFRCGLCTPTLVATLLISWFFSFRMVSFWGAWFHLLARCAKSC